MLSLTVSGVTLIILCVAYRWWGSLLSALLMIVGGFLNVFISNANGGRMPVCCGVVITAKDAIHTVLTPASRYPLLADNYPLPLGHSMIAVLSIGDVLIYLGWIVFTVFTGIYLLRMKNAIDTPSPSVIG